MKQIRIERDNGSSQYFVREENLSWFNNRLADANKLKSGAQQFAKAYKDQTRTYATPAEKKKILGELCEAGDCSEEN
jgi:hypothetical protein